MDVTVWRFGLAAFITLLVVVDPPGVVPIFVGLTKSETPTRRRKDPAARGGDSVWCGPVLFVGW